MKKFKNIIDGYEIEDSDLFIDSDYIVKDGEHLPAVIMDNNLYIMGLENLSDEDIKAIERFYLDDQSLKDFEELSTWSMDIEESSKKLSLATLGMKYRGGSGYHYSWWILTV